MSQPKVRTASLHRMVMPDHICPYGLKARHLLQREGFEVDDHWLTTREKTDAFKREHQVDTTPQTFIDGERIGGYDDLRRHFGKRVADPEASRYAPIAAVFCVAALMALAVGVTLPGGVAIMPTIERFIAMTMCVLALLKLQDLEGFSTRFLGYDLLAQRYVPYASLYPFAELLAGVLMLAGALPWLAIPVAMFIGGVGATSVFKAVYIDQRELKCACVGGASPVPLGVVSLTENLMMVCMALWMLAKPAAVG